MLSAINDTPREITGSTHKYKAVPLAVRRCYPPTVPPASRLAGELGTADILPRADRESPIADLPNVAAEIF